MSSSIYKSFTHGPIPLSFEGRRLMQNLRFAIMGAIRQGEYSDPRDEVAFARGELAQYISQLEAKPTAPAVKTAESWLIQEHHEMFRRLVTLESIVAELTSAAEIRKPPKRAARRKPRGR
jgi:hypothetical protein